MNTQNFSKLRRAEKHLNESIELLQDIPEIKQEQVYVDRLQVIQNWLLDRIIDWRKKMKNWGFSFKKGKCKKSSL